MADTVPLERRPRHFGGYSFYFRGPGLRGTGCGRRVSCGPPGAPFDTGPVKGQVGTRANSARRFFARQRRCRSVAVSGFLLRDGRSRLGLGTSPASIASTPLNGMAVYTNSSTQTRLH